MIDLRNNSSTCELSHLAHTALEARIIDTYDKVYQRTKKRQDSKRYVMVIRLNAIQIELVSDMSQEECLELSSNNKDSTKVRSSFQG